MALNYMSWWELRWYDFHWVRAEFLWVYWVAVMSLPRLIYVTVFGVLYYRLGISVFFAGLLALCLLNYIFYILHMGATVTALGSLVFLYMRFKVLKLSVA